MRRKAVERGQEASLCLAGVETASGTWTWWMRTSVRSGPDLDELGGRPASRVRLGPRQQLGWPHLVVDGTGRVLAAVGVVDHHGVEHAARSRRRP